MRRMTLAMPHRRQAFGVPATAFVVMVALTATFGLTTGPVQAAAPPVPQQVQNDTAEVIPLAPLEVSVLRTPFATDASPLSVGALGEADLRQGRSGAFLEEALQGIPGLQVQNRYNPAVGERLGVRGYGARAQFGSEGIRVLVDGIPATLPDGQSTLDHLDIGSLGRVEVVRGAASALFGNASGGVVSFQTRAPGASPYELEMEQVLGSHGLARTQGTISGTVDQTGYLVTVSSQRWEGFRTDLAEDAPRSTYGESSRLGLNARVTRPLAGGELALTANLLDLDSENPGALTQALRLNPDRPAFAGSITQGLGKEVRQGQLGARWQGPLSGLEAEFSAYGIHREVVNPIPGVIIDLTRDGGGARAQVMSSRDTGFGPLRWYAGVESEVIFDDRFNFQNQGGEPVGDPTVDQRERVHSAGLFLQADVPLPASAQGLVGVRYDRHDFRATDRMVREEGEPSRSGGRTMDAFSPSVGVNVPLNHMFGLFASLGTTFETPTTLQLANQPPPAEPGGFNADLDPQRGVSAELGLRGSLGGQVAFELAAFQTDLTNELVLFQLPDRNYYQNVGESRHRGFEASVTAASADGLVRTNLTYSRLDARFEEYESGGEDLSGNRVPGVAPERAQGSVRVRPSSWFGELSGTFVGGVPANDLNTATAPSYFVMDVRAGSEGLSLGTVDIAPWVAITNVLDRHYTAAVHVNAFAPPANPAAARYYEPGPGRSFQTGLKVTWAGGN